MSGVEPKNLQTKPKNRRRNFRKYRRSRKKRWNSVSFWAPKLFFLVMALIFYSTKKDTKSGNIIDGNDDIKKVYKYIGGFISENSRMKLQEIFEGLTFKTVQANWTLNYYNDIGELEDINDDGVCENPYLILNPLNNMCMFPNRIDVAKHYMTYGGYHGLRENYDKLASRMLYFIEYQFDWEKLSGFDELFESEQFTVNAGHGML